MVSQNLETTVVSRPEFPQESLAGVFHLLAERHQCESVFSSLCPRSFALLILCDIFLGDPMATRSHAMDHGAVFLIPQRRTEFRCCRARLRQLPAAFYIGRVGQIWPKESCLEECCLPPAGLAAKREILHRLLITAHRPCWFQQAFLALHG